MTQNLRGVVNTGAATEKEVVDRLEIGQLLARPEDMILGSAEAERFFALSL